MRITLPRPGRLVLWIVVFLVGHGAVLAKQEQPRTLTTAAEVRNLTVAQAEAHLPVKLRGVVTFYDDALFSRFIQDATAGIYLNESNVPALSPGQLVEVEGFTSPGEYAPIVVPERVRIVGLAELPAARPVTFDQLASGKEDSQFVEVSGIVRSVVFDESSKDYVIEVATGDGRLTVYAHNLPTLPKQDLVDSSVRIRGVCSSQFNRQRQLFAIRLLAPKAEDLTVEVPATADPFAIPARKIGSLFQFTPQGTYGHRVKISGTVTCFQPRAGLYVQDENYGLFAQTKSAEPLRLGERVEILGFAAPGQYTPMLRLPARSHRGEIAKPRPSRPGAIPRAGIGRVHFSRVSTGGGRQALRPAGKRQPGGCHRHLPG
jgi:hypothetical protein